MTLDLPLCCFCFEPVPARSEVSLVVYPIPEEDETQTLVAHRSCLVERVDRRIPLHPDLLDDPAGVDEE
jgi:hypothetical protein